MSPTLCIFDRKVSYKKKFFGALSYLDQAQMAQTTWSLLYDAQMQPKVTKPLPVRADFG